ncbi:competence protein ComEA helix-hairpin-helix repeat region [Pedobacter westerhofensis]|uniref:Competence protein ComEA helix-hairpin-helix repeat region n=1 Tax=Pedobacter westerhofensis TaxID=425512 RepID=A0A521D8J2_9SPHI|nr:helix-hairpin-helix domain-containing protein [Pedobacter westerhofensis]SMO68009.1 competence protein ComEA helix-hairpin-helix repeat region [Pedobacter westerhofensis]
MRKWLNIYFDFSKREYNGLLVLIFILTALTLIPSFFEFLLPENDDLMPDSIAIRKLELVEMERHRHEYRKSAAKVSRLFRFDPNHTSASDWQLLGLSPKQAAVIIRYTEKGGRFRKKEDLKRMFVVRADLYERWLPYMTIRPEDTVAFVKHQVHQFAERAAVLVSLNSADTIQLDAVKGIGPAFARRIVKYREAIGGFYKKEQLKEVYGMDSLRYNEIKDQIILDKAQVRTIFINKVEFDDLKHHPYLRYKQINAIIQYRKQHGNYSNIAELKKIAILPSETVDKLAPYISFDHD